jgi:ParB family chromosome partitioning protein
MKSADDLKARIGGNMRESMEPHRPASDGPIRPAAGQGGAFHGETAAKYRGSSRLRDALAVELDRIVPDPDQPRKEFDPGPLQDLAASLKARGQLQPVRARYDPASDRWVIIAGERRYRAAALAGLPSLVVIEAKGDPTPEDILEDQLVENCLREDLKPIEQARAFRALIDRRGWSYRQLSEHLHVAPASVARALALLELPEDLQGKVEAGELAPSVAYQVSRIDDPAAQREVADRVVSEGLSRAEAVEEVRRSTVKQAGSSKGGKGKAKAGPPKPWKFRASSGVKVTLEYPRGRGEADAVDALAEALARLASRADEAA